LLGEVVAPFKEIHVKDGNFAWWVWEFDQRRRCWVRTLTRHEMVTLELDSMTV
jgi:hypothetical protein